jgi:hypothetical protein
VIWGFGLANAEPDGIALMAWGYLGAAWDEGNSYKPTRSQFVHVCCNQHCNPLRDFRCLCVSSASWEIHLTLRRKASRSQPVYRSIQRSIF